MRKELQFIVVVVCMCLIGVTPIPANALSNLGFEDSTSSITPWVQVDNGVDPSKVVVNTSGAKEGYNCLELKASGIEDDFGNFIKTAVAQDITKSEASGLSGYVKTSNLISIGNGYSYIKITDGGELTIEYRIAGTSWLIIDNEGNETSGTFTPTSDSWYLWTFSSDYLDPFYSDVTYSLEYGVLPSSNLSVAYFDAVPTSNPVPEPATLILLMAGVLGLGVVKRRLN